MRLDEIIELVNGNILTESDISDIEIQGACSADLMSDVLASIKPDAVLLTGLTNPQVVRTSQMADIRAVIFIHDKRPPQETIELANEENLPLISSPHSMYVLSGRLFVAGLPGL